MKIKPILMAQIVQLMREMEQDVQFAPAEQLETKFKYFLVMLDAVAVKAGPEFQKAISSAKESFGLAG